MSESKHTREETSAFHGRRAIMMAVDFGNAEEAACEARTAVHLLRKERANAKARANRAARVDAYRSCGLVRVRGSLGGTYWE